MHSSTDNSHSHSGVVISGSLREGSYNTALARALAESTTSSCTLGVRTLQDIPLYSQDIEDKGYPESVLQLAHEIRQADSLWLVTPEYNGFFSSPLHNALDWLSRPIGEEHVLTHKPVALLAASPGVKGGIRALEQLKHFALNLKMRVYPQVVGVGSAAKLLDQDGEMRDPKVLDKLENFASSFLQWQSSSNS